MVYFKWTEIIISLLVLSLIFKLEGNDCAWTNFMFFLIHANEGRESKTKDSVYNAHLNFLSFFSGKNVRIIQGKYGIKVVSPGQSCSSYP